MDRQKKEGEYGVTTVHTQEFRMDKRHYTVITVPLYQDFTKNMTADTLRVHVAFTMATADGNSTVAIAKKQLESREGVRRHPKTINLPRVRQVHDGMNKMNCNAAGCQQGWYEETSN